MQDSSDGVQDSNYRGRNPTCTQQTPASHLFVLLLDSGAVLVAWRNRWATGLRLLAPLLFLAMALMVQEVMNMNAQLTGRIRDVSTAVPVSISSMPACSSELYIYNKLCLDFIYTPRNDSRVEVSRGKAQQ